MYMASPMAVMLIFAALPSKEVEAELKRREEEWANGKMARETGSGEMGSGDDMVGDIAGQDLGSGMAGNIMGAADGAVHGVADQVGGMVPKALDREQTDTVL